MEEGPFTPTENSRRLEAPNMTHTPLLEIQDSRLSPNLPLQTTYSTQGRTFFNETLFQQTGMDFAPLKGIPDVSETTPEETSRCLQMSEAVRLAATEVGSDSSSDSFFLTQHPLAFSAMAPSNTSLGSCLSQHPLAFSAMAPSNTSLGSCLSQHPLSLSGHIPTNQRHYDEEQTPHLDMRAKNLGSKDENSGVFYSQKLLNQQPATPFPPRDSWGIGQDLFLLDSNVPAPLLLEMLEKEVGLSKHCGFLSSASSSCKSVLGKDADENEMSQLMENVVLVEKEPATCVEPHQQEGRSVPERQSLKLLSDSEGKPFKIASDSQVLVSSKGHRMGLDDSRIITGLSPRPLLNKQQMQQVSETIFEDQKRKIVSAPADCKLNAPAPLQPVIEAAEHGAKCSGQVNTVVDIQTGASKNEITLSDFSIEREHKDTGISPSFNERSFIGHLAHPIHHSTPGIFTTRSLKQEGSGKPFPVKSVPQASLSCFREEILKNSCASTCIPSVEGPRVPSVEDTHVPSVEEPVTLQSGQEGKLENSDGLQVLHPLKGRIQSLPSLNFLEKVGAWNMSQSAERMSDALALHGSSGISPRQKAYSAIADSLNHILLQQQNQNGLTTGLGTSFCGPNSMPGVHSYNKKSPRALPLSRSQSENSVIAISREISRAEVSHEAGKEDDLQAAKDVGSISGASGVKQSAANIEDPLIQHYTAVLVSTVSSDEEMIESVGRRRGSTPDQFITSERVAELLRDEASSCSGSQEKSDGSQDNTKELPGFHLYTNQIGTDHFRDVSPDSLNQILSSGAGSCADLRLSSRQSSRRSSAVSGKLHSSLEDALQTPDDREINIEERIPVYLRNLGIDQSPSSILTPFIPRGPIREIELSPTELSTLKSSTDLLTQRLQLSEGNSYSVIVDMPSSLNSSTLSPRVPAGSDTGPDSPLPTELSQQPSRDHLTQCSTVCHQLELRAPTPRSAEGSSESPAPTSVEQSHVIPAVPSNFHFGEEQSTNSIQILIGGLDSKERGGSQEKLSSGLLSQEKDEKCISEGTNSSSIIPEEEKDDSFIGSQTLKEIQKLLSEAETRTPSRNFKSVSSISSTDMDSSLKQMKKMDGSGDSGSVKGSSPGVQRLWSWDETLTRQKIHEDNTLTKTVSFSGSLKWEGLPTVDFCSDELRPTSQAASEEHRMVKPVKRSEPEGCNSAVVDKNVPVLVNTAADSELCTPKDLKKIQASSSAKPLDSISNTLGNFQQVLEKTKEPSSKEACSSRGSENSSSVDSLGIKVKNLLQYEHPAIHGTRCVEEMEHDGCVQKPVSVGATVAYSKVDISAQVSDNSSSLDSLAARVKTLLEDERPVMHAAQILQSAEEEEEKAHAWVKLKLAAADTVPVLSEEDRQLIEEIKRGQLLSVRKAGIPKDQLWGKGYEVISSRCPVPKPDTGLSKIPSANELQKGTQTQNFQLVEFPEVNAFQARPVSGTDCALPSDPEIKPLNSVQGHICNELQTQSDNLLHSRQNVRVPLCNATDTHLIGLTGASESLVAGEVSVSAQAKLSVGNSPAETAKQITSITFASRKRSSSPSRAPCIGISEAVSCDLILLETPSKTSEKLEPKKQQLETHKPYASASPAAIRRPDKSVGFSSGRDYHQHVTTVGCKDESHQEKVTASVEKSQTTCVEQTGHFITENHDKNQASSQILTRLRRYDKPLGDVYDNKSNPEGMVTVQLRSIDLPPRKTEDTGFQDVMGSSVYIPKPLFPNGQESMLTKDSKFTSDPYLCRLGDVDTESSSLLPSFPPHHILTVMPVSPVPTRKALSGVHITLSPMRIDLDLPSPVDTTSEMRQIDGSRTSPQPATLNAPTPLLDATSKLKPIEVSPKTQDSSYFPRAPSSTDSHFGHSQVPVVAKLTPHQSQEPLESRQNFPVTNQRSTRVLASGAQCLENNLKTTASSQTERMSSDAITQITMESPEKTTYSAEIFVSADNGDIDGLRSHQKSHEIRSTTTPAVEQIPILNQQAVSAGTPLLLPYKPPGSSEVFYAPRPKETLRLSRVRSETTVESSHSGSNDAIPPKFPTQALGSREEHPPDAIAIKHRDGIYSKKATSKEVWTEEKVGTQKGVKESAKIRNPLESVKTTHSVFRSAQFFLHHPVPLQHEIDFLPGSEALEPHAVQGRPPPSSKNIFQFKGMPGRSQTATSLHQPKEEERFSPLTAELDYRLVEELKLKKTLERDSPRKELVQPDVRRTGHEVAKELLLPNSQRIHSKEKPEAELPMMQSAYFTSGLDELWAKYLERQNQHQQYNPCSSSSRNELSLVERLDRLARLLQNPVRHSLVPAKDEQSNVQEESREHGPKKISTQGKMPYKSNLAPRSTIGKVGESPDTARNAQQSKSRRHKIGHSTAVGHMDRNLEQRKNSEALSDTSSEVRLIKECGVLTDISSESEATLLETESATRTEASGSVSTIDTARLIRAFGHDRVQVSPKLSQLYSTISMQKNRSEKGAKGSRKGRATDYPKPARMEQKRKDTQATDSFISSDSFSTISSSRGPSSALSNKRSTRMLNKAVQAGDFEIMNSATKKHTRDVGLTFPTPTCSKARLRGDSGSETEEELAQPDGLALESKGKQQGQPSSFLSGKRPRRNKPRWLQGISWFVPTEDLKSYSEKRHGSSCIPDPGPSWFEPLPSRKPWREPLREKNWQEDHGGLQVRLAAPARDVENKPPSPFVKMTLQEALALRRPDFISSSGERVKRLKLIIEERKLQNMLQGEREELFNPPEERRSYRNASCVLSNRDYRAIRRRRTISKNEMVQRSKRIYEQLPEVRKRREEEKRQSDYSTNRLKAQLYKTKITNRVLGRKVPWE
ncbi:centrosome-associated protein ALMS1 [Elgaria multicarinata webbii]|uniref:centrosome-associated protein ALMS1 n=1 Tax=Elgaria multicarinata webbii TaxID=159646 RepID=UPI002FCCBC0B